MPMYQLEDFIRKSRAWSKAETGTDLFRRVAHLLQHDMGIRAGMFLYMRRYLPDVDGRLDKTVRVYLPWGFSPEHNQLEETIESSPWIDPQADGPIFRATERWMGIELLDEPWKSYFVSSNVGMVGAWALQEGDQVIGLMVLGRSSKTATHNDEELLSLCALHASLVFELVIARRVAEETSKRDPLTGVYNRRGFLDESERIRACARRDQKAIVAGILDVNGFKQVNDLHGHAHGDEVLEDIAKTLGAAIGNRGIVARFGGDEFVFLWCADGASPQSVRQTVMTRFQDKAYSVSLGCVEWKAEADWHSCLHEADIELYEWKRHDL